MDCLALNLRWNCSGAAQRLLFPLAGPHTGLSAEVLLCRLPMPDPLRNDDQLADQLLEDDDQDLADPRRDWSDLQQEFDGQITPVRTERHLQDDQLAQLERDSAEGYSELQ
jgi:hypothetical protein